MDKSPQMLALEKQIGSDAFNLACHAATCPSLDAQLLNCLRSRFFTEEEVPYSAEARLVLSPLCTSLDSTLFEIRKIFRQDLLVQLIHRFSARRLIEIGLFLEQYRLSFDPWVSIPNLDLAFRLTAYLSFSIEATKRLLEKLRGSSALGIEAEGWLIEYLESEVALLERVHDKASIEGLHCLAEDNSASSALEVISRSETFKDFGLSIVYDLHSLGDFSELSDRVLYTGSKHYDIILQYLDKIGCYFTHDIVVGLAEIQAECPEFDIEANVEDCFRNIWGEIAHRQIAGTVVPVGIPFSANTMLLAVNRSVFSSQKITKTFEDRFGRRLDFPRSWSDLLALVQFLSVAEPNRSPIALQGRDFDMYYEFLNILYGVGGGILNKEYAWQDYSSVSSLITTDESEVALGIYLRLSNFAQPDFRKHGPREQVEALQRGQCCLGIVWSDYAYELIGHDQEFVFSELPGEVSQLAGGLFCINSNTRHRRKSVEFIRRILSKDAQEQLMLRGYCSPFRSIYRKPKVCRLPYVKPTENSLAKGRVMADTGTAAPFISRAVIEALNGLLYEGIQPRTVLQRAERKVIQAIEMEL